MRTRIFQIVEIAQKGDRTSRVYDIFIVVIAFASIVPLMFHTERLPELARFAITALDLFSVYILFFDYLLRWMTNDFREGKPGDWKAFLRYPFRLSAIIDLAAILPSLGVLPANFMFLRALRVFRIMRYSRQLTIIANVFANEKRTLTSVFALVCMYVFIMALIMFCNEPGTFNTFIDALYWSAVTLTTIGYGDIHPTTQLGEIVVIASSLFGILVIALPAGIITGSFLDQLRQMQENRERYFETSDSTRLMKDVRLPRLHEIKGFLQTHPRFTTYGLFMAACAALDFLLYLTMGIIGQPVWLDTTGAALAAFLLEPAAGLIVGFINSLILSIANGNAGNLLYFGEVVVVVIAYSQLLPRLRKKYGPLRSTVTLIATIVVLKTAISFTLLVLHHNGVVVTEFQTLYQVVAQSLGVPLWYMGLISILIDQTLDTIVVYALFECITKTLQKRGLEPKTVAARKLDQLAHDQSNGTAGPDPEPKASCVPGTPQMPTRASRARQNAFTANGEQDASAPFESNRSVELGRIPNAASKRRLRHQAHTRRKSVRKR